MSIDRIVLPLAGTLIVLSLGMGTIVGLSAAAAGKSAIAGSLLIIAPADISGRHLGIHPAQFPNPMNHFRSRLLTEVYVACLRGRHYFEHERR